MNARSTGSPAAQDAHGKPKAPGDCSPAELHALAIVGKEAKHWRDLLTPGSYPVDLLVRIDGTVEVGDEQTRVVTSKPDLLTVLAFAFQFLGLKTREKVARLLAETFDAGNQDGLPPEPQPEMRGLAQRVIDVATRRESKTAHGNVTGKLNFTRFPSPQPGPGEAARAA